jgi:hypothetical protein
VAEERGQEPEQVPLQVAVPEGLIGGVYANFAQVTHSPYEFSLDFVSIDHTSIGGGEGARGVLVSRVKMSPAFLRDLIDTLEGNWQKWAEKATGTEES